MIQALHPEITDLKEDDIKLVTLNAVIMNGQYNDLALMVKDKLIIFVEAQSTWSINILVGLLLYLSATYHDYIIGNNLNVYGSKKMNIPEPEFYVIYTGRQKIDKDIISLRQDFWNDPDAKLDILARVIHSENKHDIIGQYIIFTHILDEQIKIHGRKRIAAENTIRICQDNDVLREYLEGLKKEVVPTMMLLFDQDYVTEMYAREREEKGERRGEKKGAMKNTVRMCQRFGATVDETIKMLAEDFGLPAERAAKYVNKHWKESTLKKEED